VIAAAVSAEGLIELSVHRAEPALEPAFAVAAIVGEDNVAFVREVCFEIMATTGVYVEPCEIVQAMLSAIHDAGIDFTDCEGGYSDIKRAIRARMRPVSLPDTPILIEDN